jgi:hypothetical protein
MMRQSKGGGTIRGGNTIKEANTSGKKVILSEVAVH